MPGLLDVTSDLQLRNPQIRVEMNRDLISTLGLSATQVETALYNAIYIALAELKKIRAESMAAAEH